MGHLLLLLPLLALPAPAEESPDTIDPILDGGQDRAPALAPRLRPSPTRFPGFVLTGSAGVYVGAVRSFIFQGGSGLDPGARPLVAIGFGARTPSPIELGLDVGAGLGTTYEPDIDADVFTIDLIVEPRLLYHLFDPEPWGLYLGVSAPVYLFDVEMKGLNQWGVGPSVIAGGARRFDDHSVFFVEAGFVLLYDYLAYETLTPTEEDLVEDPEAKPYKDRGGWFPIVRLSLGYRLMNF